MINIGRKARAGYPGYLQRKPALEDLLPSLLILFFTLVCFWTSISGQFISDDQIVIVDNERIKSVSTIPRLFTESYWGDRFADQGNYRPLTNLSFAFNYALGGLDPRGYHIINLLLHAVNGLLIYWLISCYTHRRFLSIMAALLFIVHPVHTEPVSNIAGRPELLANTFILLSWLAYYYHRTKLRHAYWISLICYFCGLLSKESAIVLIGLLVLADLCVLLERVYTSNFSLRSTPGRKLLWELARDYCGYFAVAGVYLTIRFSVLKQLGITSEWTFFKGAGFLTRLLTMNQALLKYFQLLVWPSTLSADYDFSAIPQTSQLTARVIISLIVIFAIIISGLWLLRRERLSAFAILSFFIAISIVSNIVFPTGILMAERALYLPAITVCLLAAAGLDWCYWHGRRSLVMVILPLLLVAAAVRDIYRNRDWQDRESYSHALMRGAPNNPKAHIALGVLAQQAGKDLEARGNTKAALDKYREAESYFKQAVALAPDKATPHGSLGSVYLQEGRFDEAMAELKQSIALYPRNGFVQIAIARAYNHFGDYRAAVAAFREGIALSPPDPLLNHELAVTLFQAGDLEGARAEFERVIDLKPDYAEAHTNLGLLLRSMNRPDEALSHFRAAVSYEPNNAVAHNLYGTSLLGRGEFAEAAQEFSAALAINDKLAEAHNNLGVVYLQLKQFEQAKREFEAALRINPAYTNAARNLATLTEK